MAFSTVLGISLVISIAGLIGLSLYTLYMVDKLMTRIESVEARLTEKSPTEEKSSKLLEGKQEQGVEAVGQTGPKVEMAVSPAGEGKEASKLESLETTMGAISQRLQVLADEIEANSARTNVLSNDLQATNRALDNLARGVSETNERLDILQRDISKLVLQLEEIEDTITALVKRSLQLNR
ncbi:MAG: hypothetical protein JRN52_00275 [Nitrososphaerota archaeon]|nr:hypothetical protein [Nitrososphaerota archaeon]